MNIGETDADGWTYVRFGDAAKAVQDGTHEVQSATAHKYAEWEPLNGEPWINATWRYRMRERAIMKEALRESIRSAGIDGGGLVKLNKEH